MHVITANEWFIRQKKYLVNAILIALIIYLICALAFETISLL